MTAENVTEHVLAALAGLVHGIEPDQIETPAADPDRARRLARHGTPVSVILRSFRLGQGVMLDRLLEEMPRLTDDAELISAATRKLIATMAGYVDRMSEQGVAVYQRERDRRLQWRLSMVNEAGRRIGTTLDIARTAQELPDLATENFADLVTVDLLDSVLRENDGPVSGLPTLRRVAQRSVVEGDPALTIRPEQLHVSPRGSPSARSLDTGQPSPHAGPPAPLDADGADGADDHRTHSTLVVPLRARDSTLGVAHFVRHRNPTPSTTRTCSSRRRSPPGRRWLSTMPAATHTRATAPTLQRSLLPQHTAQQSAVETAYRYLPAGAQAGVGGDWYDVIPVSGARVALVVGDVVGHGIHAAATMGRLRKAVRTLADIDLPPDELLTHLDDVVIHLSAESSTDPTIEEAGDIGATCLYAVYDPVSRQCVLARAGHVLPAVVGLDGTADLLELPPGPPLGLGGLPFEAAEFDLPEGSVLALYTDGLIEDRDHDVEAGIALLRQALAQPASSLQATCDTVLEALLPADRPHDDVALLLARTHVLGARQVASWDLDADPVCVSRARSNVAQQLSSWGLEEVEFSTGLIVSELVTNAIRCGRPPIRLRLIHDRALVCEVSDTTPHLRRARTYDEGGRGLLLVAQFAEHWGTRHARHGKTVWAELSGKESAGFPAWHSL
ncbi:SpoIIE family protein phosphatase [Streptomyces sp. NPDC007856]|uniref:ATP-binding SpoIIE family protein phosphatase n=1 Tax=Streptomyces sp. NPDC007856 TaxID=3364781 RepID=UPI0036C87EA6